MTETYALIDDDNTIINMIIWDGETAYDPSPYRLVKASDLPAPAIGVTVEG